MNKLARVNDLRAAVIRALKAALAEKDFHNTERMKEIACLLGEAVGLSREEMDNLRAAELGLKLELGKDPHEIHLWYQRRGHPALVASAPGFVFSSGVSQNSLRRCYIY